MEDVLLMRVLPRLPLRKLCQCKTLSKSWNQTLSSTWFLQGPWQETQRQSQNDTWKSGDWIVMQVKNGNRVRELVAYDSISATWQQLGRPHERPVCGSAAEKQLVSLFSVDAKFAAEKGLACVVFNRVTPSQFNSYLNVSGPRHHNNGAGDLVLLVLNPLTGSYKVISPPVNVINSEMRQYIPTLQMIDCGNSTPSYRILLQPADDDDVVYDSHVFESATSLWSSAVTSKVTCSVSVENYSRADFVRYVARKGRLVGYHVASNTWFHTSVPLPPESLQCTVISTTNNIYDNCNSSCINESFAITQSSGRILLAAPVQIRQPENNKNYAMFSLIGFAVWKLEEESNKAFEWIEVSRTPASNAFPIPYPVDTKALLQNRIKIVSSQNLICMSIIVSSYIQHSYPQLKTASFTPLVYDVASRDWQHLPPMPAGVADHDDHIVPGFFLQPAFANTAVGGT